MAADTSCPQNACCGVGWRGRVRRPFWGHPAGEPPPEARSAPTSPSDAPSDAPKKPKPAKTVTKTADALHLFAPTPRPMSDERMMNEPPRRWDPTGTYGTTDHRNPRPIQDQVYSYRVYRGYSLTSTVDAPQRSKWHVAITHEPEKNAKDRCAGSVGWRS